MLPFNGCKIGLSFRISLRCCLQIRNVLSFTSKLKGKKLSEVNFHKGASL